MKANHTVESNVKAFWISRGLLDMYLKVWVRHAVLCWQKLMVTLLINILRVKELVLSVGAVSICLLDWAHIQ